MDESKESQDDRLARAADYIESRSIDSLNIGIADLRYLFENLGIFAEEAAELLHCHPELIERKARRWRIAVVRIRLPKKHRQSGGTRDQRQQAKYTESIERAKRFIEEHDLLNCEPARWQLEHLYTSLGLPLPILARLLKKWRGRIGLILENAGIDRRSSVEQKLLRYNSKFFKSWSPEMAWVLGLLFTDGYISGNHVGIASIDIDLLAQVGQLVGDRIVISEYLQPDGRNRISKIGINHPDMAADLRELGLEERKSLTMRFPVVPEDLVRHFIRGCWDGDGGFTVSNGKVTGHYTCGSLAFIERLRDELFKAGVARNILHGLHRIAKARMTKAETNAWVEDRRKMMKAFGDGPYPLAIHKRKNANAYDLRLGGDTQLHTLYRYFYDDVPATIFLSRKREILARFLGRAWRVNVLS